MKRIGKGMFTTCYLKECGKRVQLRSVDRVKECQALWGFPEHRLYAPVERIEPGVYEMDYLPRPSSLKRELIARDWELYKILRQHLHCTVRNYDGLTAKLDALATRFPQYAEEFAVMQDAADALCNWMHDIGFEISPRNVTVKNSRLVLLDCFYSVSDCDAVWSSRSHRW